MKLLITLGHNSSAILVDGNKVLCGYEEERLSGVKSDSSFPSLSIKKILEYYPEAKLDVSEIFISHWFWSWDLTENKYYRPKFLAANFPKAKITSVDYNNTHHDLHAKSLWNFLDGNNSGLTIVADGFGNFGECLSVYVDGRLDHRSYETKFSLGLMYQYAIRYLGMKENQDEYKLLGYEQNVSEAFKTEVKELVRDISLTSSYGLLAVSTMKHNMTEELDEAWSYWKNIFDIVNDVDKALLDRENKRAKIAYFTQQVLESVMLKIIKRYDIKNIKVTGGVFYNVKLNNAILRYSDKFEANPLAGDQGCALGFTDVRFNDLYWGKRDLELADNSAFGVITDIKTEGFSEIFTGDMEFGPRALCNTTCLALPTLELVEKINQINGRDTVMPMAPVVTEKFALDNFNDIEKVGKSKYFMIIAYDFKSITDEIRGAAHYDSDRDVYTGRLQLSPNDFISNILDNFGGILINTSLNAHGQPIIYDDKDFGMMRYIQDEVNK